MNRPQFTGHYPLEGLVWSAQLQISNGTLPRLQKPGMRIRIADPAATFPEQEIQLWERPLRMQPKDLYEVCFGLQSVSTLFAIQLEQARRL